MALIRPAVLVLRALGLGDFLTGVPAMRALRRARPDHDILLAAPAALQPLVRLARAADGLLPTEGLQPPPWAGDPPALAVNLHGRGPESHRVLQELRPTRLVAFGCEDAGHQGPGWRADEHEVRRWCRLVREALDVPADPTDLLLGEPDTSPPVAGALVVHPGAAFASRRWPADRFAHVARWGAAQGLDVVVTGGQAEVDLARRVAAEADLPDAAVLAGATGLSTLASLVAHAALVVCGDTGVAHLASAFATRSVVLFGPTPPSRWGPPTEGPHVALWHGAAPGDPWAERPDPALLAIEPDEVVAAAARLVSVSETERGTRTTPASA